MDGLIFEDEDEDDDNDNDDEEGGWDIVYEDTQAKVWLNADDDNDDDEEDDADDVSDDSKADGLFIELSLLLL